MQGHLTEEQRSVLLDVVKDRLVYDLGAGTCHLARQIADMGAREVVAVDRNTPPPNIDGIVYQRSYFQELVPIESGVAFVSWPQQYVQGLTRIVTQAPVLVYLGCNTDYSACGPTDFWENAVSRRIEHHIPDKRNTLIVYGERCGDREMVLEERAGLDRSRVYSYGEKFDE